VVCSVPCGCWVQDQLDAVDVYVSSFPPLNSDKTLHVGNSRLLPCFRTHIKVYVILVTVATTTTTIISSSTSHTILLLCKSWESHMVWTSCCSPDWHVGGPDLILDCPEFSSPCFFSVPVREFWGCTLKQGISASLCTLSNLPESPCHSMIHKS
jgi:hypothetical protein